MIIDLKTVSQLKKNLTANFAGSIWQAIMTLMFIPLYIKFMGIESYGLVGIFATLQVMFGILDMGLSNTLNREMARLSALPGSEQEMRDLVRTLEIVYWAVAVSIGIVVIIIAPLIVDHWLKADKLPPEIIKQALVLMGIAMALRWPAGFYLGGIRGLQRQVLLNVITMVISTLSGAGAVLILWLVSPTIQAFFSWQIMVSAANTCVLAFFLWRSLPSGNKNAVFDKQLLKGIWKFAVGMTGITLSAMLMTQLDKVILSKMLSLDMFGYYTLAGVLAGGLSLITIPIFNSIFPRFTALAASGDEKALKQLYHTSTQLIAVLVLPVAMTLVFFSYDILLLWTRNSITAQNTAPIVSILIIGTAINALMYPPYTLQLASGWTKIGLQINSFLIVLIVPAIIILTKFYGVVGAAFAWVILNGVYMIIGIPMTHRKLLKGEAIKWFSDILPPSAASLAAVLIGRHFLYQVFPQTMIILPLGIIFLFTSSCTVASSQYMRSFIKSKLLGVKSL